MLYLICNFISLAHECKIAISMVFANLADQDRYIHLAASGSFPIIETAGQYPPLKYYTPLGPFAAAYPIPIIQKKPRKGEIFQYKVQPYE